MFHLPMTAATPILQFGAALLLILAALNDVAVRTIPNSICGVLAAIGVLLRLSDGTLLPSLLTAFLMLIATTYCCWRGWLGGGDVKLLSAVALLLPVSFVPACVFWIAIAGGLLALGYILLGRLLGNASSQQSSRPTSRLGRIWRVELFRIRRGGPLPYGVGIAAGAILMLMKHSS